MILSSMPALMANASRSHGRFGPGSDPALVMTRLPFTYAAIGSTPDVIPPRVRFSCRMSHAFLINLNAKAWAFQSVHHAALYLEYFGILKVRQQVVVLGVVVDAEGHLLNDKIRREKCQLHTR